MAAHSLLPGGYGGQWFTKQTSRVKWHEDNEIEIRFSDFYLFIYLFALFFYRSCSILRCIKKQISILSISFLSDFNIYMILLYGIYSKKNKFKLYLKWENMTKSKPCNFEQFKWLNLLANSCYSSLFIHF